MPICVPGTSSPKSGFFPRTFLCPRWPNEAESQEYLDAVERLEPEVDDLARKIVDNLNIDVCTLDDNA